MLKSQRLLAIVTLAEEREQAAVKKQTESQQTYAARQHKLNELLTYRDEYQARFKSVEVGARFAYQFNDFRMFLQRLDYAISEQEKLVAQAAQEAQQKRLIWLKYHERTQSLMKALTRLQQEERVLVERREQRESDERAQRLVSAYNEREQ